MPTAQNPPVPVPVIHTERLTLRGHRLEDFADCARMWGRPEVTRYIGGKPLTREQVWTILLRYVGHWALLEFGYWAVEDRATGDYLGEVGFADGKRDIEPSLDGMVEMGWVLVPEVHGRGLATEAVRAAQAWLEEHRGAPRTVCLIDPGNAASIRVAEKCGFEWLVETTYKEEPTLVFTRAARGSG
jgi:RimJ/RimL family protein N-acetyltransferase